MRQTVCNRALLKPAECLLKSSCILSYREIKLLMQPDTELFKATNIINISKHNNKIYSLQWQTWCTLQCDSPFYFYILGCCCKERSGQLSISTTEITKWVEWHLQMVQVMLFQTDISDRAICEYMCQPRVRVSWHWQTVKTTNWDFLNVWSQQPLLYWTRT